MVFVLMKLCKKCKVYELDVIVVTIPLHEWMVSSDKNKYLNYSYTFYRTIKKQ